MAGTPVALITGASAGIGEATARAFARQGYRVALAARRLDRLEALAAEINRPGGLALPIQADLGQFDQVQAMVRTALEHFGQVDVLFNNAGFGRLSFLEQLEPVEDVQAQLQVNLLGTIWACQALLPHMIERRSGVIINMSSVAGLVALPTYSVYAASKFGVCGFSEALRREVSPYGVRVALICPGGVATEFAQTARLRLKSGSATPGWLRLSADQVADAVVGLARRPRRMLVIPWPLRLAVWANALLPGLVDWTMARRFTARER